MPDAINKMAADVQKIKELDNRTHELSYKAEKLQNELSIDSVKVYDKVTPDSVFWLYPLNKISFDGEIYLRCAESGGRALIRVVPFLVDSDNSSGSFPLFADETS